MHITHSYVFVKPKWTAFTVVKTRVKLQLQTGSMVLILKRDVSHIFIGIVDTSVKLIGWTDILQVWNKICLNQAS